MFAHLNRKYNYCKTGVQGKEKNFNLVILLWPIMAISVHGPELQGKECLAISLGQFVT